MTPNELNAILAKPAYAARNPMLKPDGFVNLSPLISVLESPRTAYTYEQQLHYDIMEECERRGWLYFHGAMCKRTHRTSGEPDFHCLLPNGKVLFIECKTRRGKLSESQQSISAHMNRLGHALHVVRSIQDFMQIVDGALRTPISSGNSLGTSLSYQGQSQ